VYDFVLCELTYVCALASAHTQNPFVYIYSQVYIYIYLFQESYHGYVGISTCAVHSHTCLCPCECSNFEPFCIHAYVHKYIYVYHIANTFIYEPVLCELTNMFVLLRVPTPWNSLYTCIYSQTYLCYIISTLVYNPMLCKLTDGCALASAHS